MKSETGGAYEVKRLLGAGGQGEVYEVERGTGKYALKWYFERTATPAQRKIIENLITKGAPDKSFLWPKDLISGSGSKSKSFGYIMDLRPPSYKSIVDMMKRRAEPSFHAICKAAFNLTKGYEKLHGMGYSYRDISFANLFFDPENGEVLICDNDNVSPNNAKDSSVYGTPRFMAPEIVIGRRAKPSRNTDLYSLAVLLFYMLMMNHPLEGRLEAEIKCMDGPAMKKLYGTNPVFIFDPKDKSNRPLKGYQDNAEAFWPLYPEVLRELFVQSFTTGLAQPNRRVTEKQWMDVFANMTCGIMHCSNNKCGAEIFFDAEKASLGAAHTCWSCGQAVQTPSSLVIGKSVVLLTSDMKIYSHHVKGDYDMSTVCGKVVRNPNNPNMWGIMNESSDNWTYIKEDGTQMPLAPGKSAAMAKGARVNFGVLSGEFR